MIALLHIGHYWFVPAPTESHHFFGAGFLFFGVLLVVETLAGGVWFRSKLRAAIWPAGAMLMGEGLILVSVLDPADRLVHFSVGALVLTAGWLELRYRFGQVTLFSTNFVVVPALLGRGFEMGVIHGHGSTLTAVSHIAMGVTAAMMAGARVYQARLPGAVTPRLAMGMLVILLALILLFVDPGVS
jgi:hypothetical protein